MPLTHFHCAPPLERGASVALVAPAGPLQKADELPRALDNARSLGWEPRVGAHASDNTGYLAGNDRDRLNDINTALRDPNIDAVWCLRGGYGLMRILDGIDYDALSRLPKTIVGYSDATALHSAIQRRCKLITYHGPTAREPMSDFSRDSFERAVVAQTDSCGVAQRGRELNGGNAEGRLVGGNLSLLAALAGTPYAPDYTDGILILEDIGEPVYRIDRMLRQLLLTGTLRDLRAVAFGDCTGCKENAGGGGRPLDDVITEFALELGVPCLAGIPCGHIDEQWTIPLGAIGRLDTKTKTLNVTSFTS